MVAVPLAVLSALRRNRPADHVHPPVHDGRLRDALVPARAVADPDLQPQARLAPDVGLRRRASSATRSLTLPAITVGLYLAPILLRTLRVGIIETLGAEYIEAARARGLSERRVVCKHVLRNSLISTVTVLGAQHRLPAHGPGDHRERLRHPRARLASWSRRSSARDYPTIQALTLIFGVAVIVDQPAHRSRLRGARSADAAVSSQAAPDAVAAKLRAARSGVAARLERRAASPSAAGRGDPLDRRRDRRRDRLRRLAAPLLSASANPNKQNLTEALQAPSLAHPFGTDKLGRDIFTRVIYGGRIDLTFAVVTTSSRSSSALCSARSPAIAAAGSTRSSSGSSTSWSPSRSSS